MRGRVEIGIPINARRPTSAYPTRTVPAPKLAPESERRHVVVYLRDARPQTVTPMRVAIHQLNESFTPRVVAVTVGSEVEFPNDDPIYHNVFSLSRAKNFNLGRYPKGDTRRVRFDRPGVVKVFCEIHSHMSATVMVFDHPWFAVPDEDGTLRAAGRARRRSADHRMARTARRHHAARARRVGPSCRRRLRPSGSRTVRRPPRLVARTLTVTFVTVAIILSVVFIVLMVDARDRVRASEIEKLSVAEKVFTALEARRQQEQLAAIATVAENPTLKAALDTYFTESAFTGLPAEQEQSLRDTVTVEAEKLATLTGADVLAILDANGRIFVSAGPLRDRWPPASTSPSRPTTTTFQDIAVLPQGAFRISGSVLSLLDRDIGALVVGTSLDANYARELSNLASADVVITVNGMVAASTAPGEVAADLVQRRHRCRPTRRRSTAKSTPSARWSDRARRGSIRWRRSTPPRGPPRATR